MNEEELKKEIESTKQKLHKLYEQQWKLRMNKYKEFKKQQQRNDKKESKKAMNQNKTRHGRFCHFYQQCSPFYNWYRYSQQQQPKLCEMTNDVSFKQKKKQMKEIKIIFVVNHDFIIRHIFGRFGHKNSNNNDLIGVHIQFKIIVHIKINIKLKNVMENV